MVGSLDFSALRDLFSILLLQVSMWGSDSFLVIGPSEPIVAMLGTDTVLPCRVSPAMNVESMELRWFRSQFSEAVYVYKDGMEQAGEQLVDFKGRAELVKDYITEGRVAVRIYGLRISDNGIYKCFFQKGSDYEEATLELKVIGLGSGPRVFMVGPEDKGIRLTCTSKGWFPQPEVQWTDATGEKIPSLSEDENQDDDGLFQIEASLIVKDSSKTEVSCSMKNPFFGQEQVETISIPESFFPRTSPWKGAFAGTFLLLGIFLSAVVFLAWKERQEKKRVQEVQKEKEKESEAKELLKKELDRRKELYQRDWRKAKLYADWRKEQFKAVAVTLDSERPPGSLIISNNKKQVSLKGNVPQDGDASVYQGKEESEAVLSALGQNSFETGRYYWEVEVNIGTEAGPETKWAVGVCLDSVTRDGWFVESPEKGFWVLAYKEGEFKVPIASESLSPRQHHQRIGVFLDQEDGDLSFYNMLDGSHIFSFIGITLHQTLRPYFSLQGAGTSVTICTTSDDTDNYPDSSPNISVTHLRSGDMGVPQEANHLLLA
ncbi:butyrophilin subfamily 3 member A2-like isoform X2 [Mustela putorius furo]|uniref:Butyrophilin subfamily 3 member A2-like isoform X2 n=1 Tax=Mustela putorius furo TaxID=9669 RepID=A0A8U0RTE0_MUSPF|nr:butyrophilin subfamily 3 member A2-like isoform X2 [Mustela putorius furo]